MVDGNFIPGNNSNDMGRQPMPPMPAPAGKKARFKGKKLRFNKTVLLVIVMLLVVVGLGGFAWMKDKEAKKAKQESAKLQNPQEAARIETAKLKADVAKLIELPNEDPTVATVVDASKLKTQSFFANAQNGDKVLLFPQAKKAILYRPSINKVIEVAPINIGDGTTGAQTNTTTPTTKKP